MHTKTIICGHNLHFLKMKLSIRNLLNGRIAPSAIVKRPFEQPALGQLLAYYQGRCTPDQAPCGELKLKFLGSSSGIETSGWSIQAYIIEYDSSWSSSTFNIVSLPSAISMIVQLTELSDFLLDSSSTNLSTTIWILCFSFYLAQEIHLKHK